MRISKFSFVSLTLGLMILFSLLLVDSRTRLQANRSKPDLEKLVSLHPPEWKMVDSKRSNFWWSQTALTVYDAVALRTYQHADGRQVSVVMTWNGDGLDRQRIHEPQVCYNSSGFTVSPMHRVSISTGAGSIDAMAFTARQASREEDVVYWRVTDGIWEREPDNRNSMVRRFLRLLYLRGIFRGELPDNLMVRVSSVRPTIGQRTTAHFEYVRDLFKTISPADRARIIGR
jgi:EpsI family protein